MNFLKPTGLAVAVGLMLASCGNQGNTVETTEAQDVAEATGQTLTIDTNTSKVNWMGYKPAGKHFGYIPLTNGELSVEGNAIKAGKFVFDLTQLKIEDMEESNENYGKLFGHLQSDDFFDTENHPLAVFEVTNVEPYASDDQVEDKEEFETDYTPNTMEEQMVDNPTHWISGNLTIRGNTKNIKFPAAVTLGDGSVSAKAGFNIDRTEWGVSYNDESNAVDKLKDNFIYNTVNIEFDIQAN
ncbi:YceI family protein [Pararhodonellum marinum]|uniref:YceI family protein n=1 Tax=Pararhodonellum marinum TaxID=2755358 RepID=UPI00188E32DD|nr:YceI family protein [Pararhodonellum marinum]